MKKKLERKYVTALFVLLISNIILFTAVWAINKYDRVYIDHLLFQMTTNSDGAQDNPTSNAVVVVGFYCLVITTLEVFLYKILSGRYKKLLFNSKCMMNYKKTRFCRFVKKHVLAPALAMLIFSIAFFDAKLNIIAYVDTVWTDSDFIETHYADPDPQTVSLTFPKQKRNLIYIFLESMENTYAETTAGKPIKANYIPELTELAEENVSFSNTDNLGGALSFSGTTWTSAAMVAQTSGVPIKVSLPPENDEAYGIDDDFLPGITAIGDILAMQGYNQTVLMGSDSKFHGQAAYFLQHGNYNVVDITTLKEEKRLPEDYEVWWGIEDMKAFEYAKEEINRLAEKNEPFNFTMFTLDTHFPDGYKCPVCKDKYDGQYPNVLACSSAQVNELVNWIKEQPFYENTTIIISGDHLTMDADFLDEIDENYVRTIYNCIINSAVEPRKEHNRQFATFDMFPTTLAAMGVEIEGERLGLGTNLFSDTETLTEQYGYEALDYELQKNSEYYNTSFLD